MSLCFQPLNLECDLLVSKLAFKFNLSRYNADKDGGWKRAAVVGVDESIEPTVGLCTLNQVDP
jgi:hypothetical protein